ncbi:MAG TPA: phosphoribosyl-ATP pyrophosphatase, partial [Archaeoglobus profundus]|nr:phosphoribosyl-ATP pyrophosphatase [Archaeoglobus profundus]
MILDELYEVIMDRKINPKKESYTSQLLYHEKG